MNDRTIEFREKFFIAFDKKFSPYVRFVVFLEIEASIFRIDDIVIELDKNSLN